MRALRVLIQRRPQASGQFLVSNCPSRASVPRHQLHKPIESTIHAVKATVPYRNDSLSKASQVALLKKKQFFWTKTRLRTPLLCPKIRKSKLLNHGKRNVRLIRPKNIVEWEANTIDLSPITFSKNSRRFWNDASRRISQKLTNIVFFQSCWWKMLNSHIFTTSNEATLLFRLWKWRWKNGSWLKRSREPLLVNGV